MDELYLEQQDRDNESGIDLCECYEWHKTNRLLLDGFYEIRPIIQGKENEKTRNTPCAKTPF